MEFEVKFGFWNYFFPTQVCDLGSFELCENWVWDKHFLYIWEVRIALSIDSEI